MSTQDTVAPIVSDAIIAKVRALPGVRASDTVTLQEHAPNLVNLRKESWGSYLITGKRGGSLRMGWVFLNGRISTPVAW